MIEMLLLLVIILFLGAVSWLQAGHSRKINEEIHDALEANGWKSLTDWLKDHFSR